jgi:hypothetical protein
VGVVGEDGLPPVGVVLVQHGEDVAKLKGEAGLGTGDELGRDSPIVKHYPCFVTCVNYALCSYS